MPISLFQCHNYFSSAPQSLSLFLFITSRVGSSPPDTPTESWAVRHLPEGVQGEQGALSQSEAQAQRQDQQRGSGARAVAERLPADHNQCQWPEEHGWVSPEKGNSCPHCSINQHRDPGADGGSKVRMILWVAVVMLIIHLRVPGQV